MDFKTYVQSVVAAYVEKQENNMIFIKHYNTLDITKEEILADVKNTDNKIFLYHEYVMHDMHEAYEPVLDWIKQCYEQYYKDNMSVDDFLRACHVYSMHIEPFTGFLEDGECRRKEDVLHSEILFEAEQILRDIIGILEYISQDYALILMLSKFHLAPYSTIQLFKQIVEKTMNVHTIIMYNDEFSITGYKKGVWESLLQKSEELNLQLDWGSMDSRRTIDVHDEFWFDNDRKGEYLLMLNNMYHTFALEDAYYYLTDINFRIDEKTIWLTRDEQIPFLLIAAMVDLNINQVNHALVLCDKLLDMRSYFINDYYTSYMYYFTRARARMMMSQTKLVEENCRKCIEIAKSAGSEFLACKAEALLWSTYCSIGKDIFEYNFNNKVDPEVIKNCEKVGLNNFLAYLYVFGFENEPETIEKVANGEMIPYYFNKAIEIGTALGNDNFLMNAYMKNIILYSRAGYHRFVREMYMKRLKVLRRPNPVREAHMLAGLGYNSIILEDFEKAHEYLMKSVLTIYELGDPDDTMNSLYNLAMNYFVSESYENVIKTIELILKMLKEMNYRALRACSTTKLYSLIAIACYYHGEYYNCYYYMSRMEVIVEHMINYLHRTEKGVWEEDLLLYHLVKGMLYKHEENAELARREYDKASKFMTATVGAKFYTFPVIALEKADLFRKMSLKDEEEEIYSEIFEFCDKEELVRKKKKLEYFREHGERDKEPILNEVGELPVNGMIALARQVGTTNKLAKKESDIKFLTVLQEAISRENLTVDDLFKNTSAVIKNSYNLDEIMIIRRKNGSHVMMYDSENNVISSENTERVFEFFQSYKQAFLTNLVDKNFVQFMPAMKPFNERHVMTMIGIPIIEQSGTETYFLGCVRIKRHTVSSRMFLGEDDLDILKFAFSQFCEMMRRIDSRLLIERMNQKLEQSAITDHLTGITNRSGFSKQLDLIANQDEDCTNVILYLDLDNFKYYNDTFGHDIGDLVLVCFAEMFKKMTKDQGLAVRYGGDEFIILLYNKTERDGAHLAEQIYDEIKDGMKDKIRQRLGRNIEIPENKKISCSIGISSFNGGAKDAMETALNEADQMLYYVKRNGKSMYKMYHG